MGVCANRPVAVPDFPPRLKAKCASRCRLAGLARDALLRRRARRLSSARVCPGGLPRRAPAPDRLASPAGFSNQVGNWIGSIDSGGVVAPAGAGGFGLGVPPATLSTEGAAAGGGPAAFTGSTAAYAPVSG